MRINTNVSALNAWKNLSVTGSLMAKSLEKLSSGYRINKAADDAAGLAISEQMRSQTAGLRQAARNAQDGISLIQTAEGALNESHAILQRMRELMVQANNGTNKTEDRQAIQTEIQQLMQELDGIASRTEFNGQSLLDGTLGGLAVGAATAGTLIDATGYNVTFAANAQAGSYTVALVEGGAGVPDQIRMTRDSDSTSFSIALPDVTAATTTLQEGTVLDFAPFGITLTVKANATPGIQGIDVTDAVGALVVENTAAKIQIGANANQALDVSISKMDSSAGGLNVTGLDVTNFVTETFTAQLGRIDAAIGQVSDERAKMGAYQNRLEHTINNLQTAAENLTAAESRIRDVDMALEMASFTRHQILQQAGTAMLAQANVQTQSVLKLLG